MKIPIYYEPYALQLSQGHPGVDAGYDVRTPVDVTIWNNSIHVIDTGIRINCPPGLACIVMNKSGLAVKGLTKTAELIDPGYVGTIKIALQYDRGMEGEPALKFKRGDKIAQIMFVPFEYPEFVTIENPELLGESMRGDGGFGSTGK